MTRLDTPRLDAQRLAAVAGLAVALALLVASGSTLPPPPAHPAEWFDWWAATDPALALGAILRTVAAALCAYLLAVTLLDLVATVVGLRPLSRVAHRLAPAAWRAVVLRPVAMGTLALPTLFAPALTAAPVMAQQTDATTAPDAGTSEDPVVITMSWQGQPVGMDITDHDTSSTVAPPTTVTTLPPQAVPPTTPSVPDETDAGDELPPDHTADHTQAPASTPPTTTSPTPMPAPIDAAIHVVAPGDSFWSIATEHVAARLGREPSAREVGPYWRALIAANEDRLPVPGNPDLIHPGMQLQLPAPR